MIQTHSILSNLKEIEFHKTGWDIFPEEVAWFIYDFFKYDLNGYEKLVFYSYYINGMTLQEIASAADCTFQNIGVVVKRIEKRLRNAWKNQDKWRNEINDCQSTNRRHCRRNKKRS